MTVTTALVFEGVSKTFLTGGLSVRALQSVDISIQAGKVTGLIGPDGAGKTTLMRLAGGLLRPMRDASAHWTSTLFSNRSRFSHRSAMCRSASVCMKT